MGRTVGIAEQTSQHVVRRAGVTIDRIHTGQDRHATVAGTLRRFARDGNLRGIGPHQRPPFAVTGQHQQFALVGRCRHREFFQILIRLCSRAAIDILQLIDADVLPQCGQQRPPRQTKRLLDTEELRELFEQVRVDHRRQTHAGFQWPQCDLQMRTGGVHQLLEHMQSKDRAEFAANGLVAAVQSFASLGHHRWPQVTAALQREKQIDGAASDAEHLIESVSFDGVQRFSVGAA